MTCRASATRMRALCESLCDGDRGAEAARRGQKSPRADGQRRADSEPRHAERKRSRKGGTAPRRAPASPVRRRVHAQHFDGVASSSKTRRAHTRRRARLRTPANRRRGGPARPHRRLSRIPGHPTRALATAERELRVPRRFFDAQSATARSGAPSRSVRSAALTQTAPQSMGHPGVRSNASASGSHGRAKN